MKAALNTLLFLVACAGATTACADILEAANALYNAGSFHEALEIYRHPEFSHDAAVQNRIGTIYLEPALRDEKQSAQWFRKSAEQGNRYGQYNLGLAYKNGTGISRDYAKAMQCFYQSAAQGYPPAMNAIGALFEEGKGVEKNGNEAMQWYLKAAEKGDVRAMRHLSGIYEHGRAGQPANKARAQAWKAKAEAAGK